MLIISETFILTEVDEEGGMKERFIWDGGILISQFQISTLR